MSFAYLTTRHKLTERVTKLLSDKQVTTEKHYTVTCSITIGKSSQVKSSQCY